ncbi:MAG: cytochrome c [Hyphomonadaceae bacterium]
MRAILAAAALALVSACASQEPDPRIADGRVIAETQCARCHAVGMLDESPRPDAPVFRTILSRYSAEALSEELINGIQVAHPMPDFQFNPQGVDSLIAYLRSIQREES